MARRWNLELVTLGETAVPGISQELERTFQAHSGLVFRTAYRILGNASDAEDVLQNVFLRLLGRPSDALPLQNEESYFRRAAINVALDVVRARAEDKSVPLTDQLSEPSRYDRSDQRESLRRALSGLKPREAEIFALRFFEDYTNQEIGRMLGISQVLVAVIVHRTRRQLQKAIRSS